MTTIDVKYGEPQIREVTISDGKSLRFVMGETDDLVWIGDAGMKANKAELGDFIEKLRKLHDQMRPSRPVSR